VPVRCLIVDDSHAFLRAARDVLEREGISVVGVAATAAEGLRSFGLLHPDVTLVDLDLGEDDGLELARTLAAYRGDVILISAYPEQDFADVLAAGPPLAFLPKTGLSGDAVRQTLERQRDSR